MILRCRGRVLDLSTRTRVMGIVNVTPDSFSDGGRYLEPGAAIARCRELAAQGADLLDLGAESTRPGSQPVPAAEQIRRLEPVLRALAERPDEAGTGRPDGAGMGRPDGAGTGRPEAALISVDTRSAEVAARALELGAHMINDVSALSDPEMAPVVGASGAALVLMHMRGTPATMQDDPRYDDVAREAAAWLRERLAVARAAGVAEECLAVDPGIGFGKKVAHSLELLARLDELARLGRPVLVGASRKRFLGALLGEEPVERRLEASLAAAVIAAWSGAAIVRVHDVVETVRVLRVTDAVRAARRA